MENNIHNVDFSITNCVVNPIPPVNEKLIALFKNLDKSLSPIFHYKTQCKHYTANKDEYIHCAKSPLNKLAYSYYVFK